jgi:hypothetical protein
VAHLIPQAAAACPSERADRRGKGPHCPCPNVFEDESDEGTNADAYLNMTLFTTQLVRIF